MATDKIKRIIPYAVVLSLSVIFWVLACGYECETKGGNLGPDFWPKLLLGLTMVVCLYEIFKTAFFHRGICSGAAANPPQAEAPKRYPVRLTIGAVMTIAYVCLVPVAGFILCTLVYLILFMIVGRYRRIWVIAANGIIGTILFVLIFMKAVYVSLPLGQGPFQQFSLLVLNVLGIR
jgi:hypothetical protein